MLGDNVPSPTLGSEANLLASLYETSKGLVSSILLCLVKWIMVLSDVKVEIVVRREVFMALMAPVGVILSIVSIIVAVREEALRMMRWQEASHQYSAL